MTRAAVVQYHTTTVSTERNRQLIEDVLVELAARDPGGLDYQVFRFDAGVGFLTGVPLALPGPVTCDTRKSTPD